LLCIIDQARSSLGAYLDGYLKSADDAKIYLPYTEPKKRDFMLQLSEVSMKKSIVSASINGAAHVE
jgi:hypothetical protein